jgi:hypothetical protein
MDGDHTKALMATGVTPFPHGVWAGNLRLAARRPQARLVVEAWSGITWLSTMPKRSNEF